MAQNGVLKPSLTLQMAAGYSAYIPKLYATQTDNESIDVSVKLMDKTVPYIVPEGYQVNLRAKKPDGNGSVSFTSTLNQIKFSTDLFDDISEWKQYLAQNPMTVIYALETPIETPISEETLQAYRALHLYHPNTNIFATDNAGLKAQYVADTELFINNLLADIASLHAVQDAGLGL